MDGRGRAVYGPDGSPTMLYGLGVDVTARKHAEQERERLLARERQASRAKDEFLAVVSHELRTTLAAIRALVETLNEGAIDDQSVAHGFLGQVVEDDVLV